MEMYRGRLNWRVFLSKRSVGAAVLVTAALVGLLRVNSHTASGVVNAQNQSSTRESGIAKTRVETTKPVPGALQRVSTQPGSIYAFETADLFSKVSGFLKKQNVDLGDVVKRGDLLAEIDTPELHVEVDQCAAELAQARAQVEQMKARTTTADAKWRATQAIVLQSEADLARATAQKVFHEKQYQRFKKLFDLNSAVEEKLVDEKQDEMESAQAAEHAAQAMIVTAKANVAAAAAKVKQAESDVVGAEAKVRVLQAALERAKIMADYTRITSPYDGVVIKRSFCPGDFIRSAERAGDTPLLVVERVDLMRVVVQVPDRDVPLMHPGDDATIEVDALPGETFTGTVARTANSEDQQSRTMRTEIDVPNPSGRLRQGMYGRVTIHLKSTASAMKIPASCLAGPVNEGRGTVYVIRGGTAHQMSIEVASDDGIQLEVRRGLADNDDVVRHVNGPIGDGVAVEVTNKVAE